MVSVYLSCEDTAWRQPSTNQEEALYQDTQSASTLILNFPASRTVRSKCYLMVYGINNMVLIIPVMVFSTAAHKEGWGLKNWCFWTVLLEKTLESPARRSNQSILKEINPEYLLEGLTLKLKLQYFDHLTWRAHSLEQTLILGNIEGRRRRGVTEDEMARWHRQLNGHEFEQTPEDGEGQGSLACYSPWGRRVRHNLVTEQQCPWERKMLFWLS